MSIVGSFTKNQSSTSHSRARRFAEPDEVVHLGHHRGRPPPNPPEPVTVAVQRAPVQRGSALGEHPGVDLLAGPIPIPLRRVLLAPAPVHRRERRAHVDAPRRAPRDRLHLADRVVLAPELGEGQRRV